MFSAITLFNLKVVRISTSSQSDIDIFLILKVAIIDAVVNILCTFTGAKWHGVKRPQNCKVILAAIGEADFKEGDWGKGIILPRENWKSSVAGNC